MFEQVRPALVAQVLHMRLVNSVGDWLVEGSCY